MQVSSSSVAVRIGKAGGEWLGMFRHVFSVIGKAGMDRLGMARTGRDWRGAERIGKAGAVGLSLLGRVAFANG